MEEKGKLPQGIIESDRKKTMTFGLKNKEAKSEV